MTLEAPASSRVAARRRADLALIGVAALWGLTFPLVKDALDAAGPFTFVAARFGLAALVMAPWVILRARGPGRKVRFWDRSLILAGALLGGLLFAGYAFQTAGLQYTGAGRAGFITGLNVVLVPLIGGLLGRQKIDRAIVCGVTLALAGLVLLSLRELATQALDVTLGDLLVFGCAWAFAAHILVVDRFAPGHDVVPLTFAQIAVVAALATAAALLWETPSAAELGAIAAAAIFTGLLCTVAAFTFQVYAQRFTSPTHTALIFSAEPVFAALFAYLLAGERLGPAELGGCALILGGMLVVQLRPG
ncbi:MAG: DMT family transporter [Chloroflexi bacterium]|nr:DMT family transporter [Chloroflexota bacterium]